MGTEESKSDAQQEQLDIPVVSDSVKKLFGYANQRVNGLGLIRNGYKLEIRLNGKLLMDTDDTTGQVISNYLSGFITGYDIKSFS